MSLMLPLMYRSKLEPGLIELRTAAVDSRITFTRASDRTYFDSAGVLQTATTDVWPLEFDPATGECLGRSVWAAATNLVTYSQEFDNAAWSVLRCSFTANAEVAPDGTTTAEKLVEDSSAATTHIARRTSSVTVANGSVYTSSVFAKAGERNWFALQEGTGATATAYFNLATGALGSTTGTGSPSSTIQDCGDGWYRCTITFTAIGVTANLRLVIAEGNLDPTYTGDGASGLYVWGAQFEAGAIATPYIPTTSATVTRAADSAVISTLSNIGFNATEGTIVVRGNAPSASGTRALATVSDGTNNERLLIYQSVSNIYFQSRDGGVTQADINSGAVTASAAMAVAVVYKANDFAASLKGAAAVADTSGTLPTVDRLVIGADGAGTALQWNGYIRSILYIPRRITNAELAIASAA